MDALPVRRLRSHRWRPLTAGEIAMASLLFRDAIDYARVRIHSRRYMPFQPKNCAMTPNGSMYFHASCFLDDYSQANLAGQHWFMHEMVPFWQSAHHSSAFAGLSPALVAAPKRQHQCCDDRRTDERKDDDVIRLVEIHAGIEEEY